MNNSFLKLKKDKNFHWTNHIMEKMRYYKISPSLVKRIVRYPERSEEGIVENTIASMKTNKSKKRQEIWVMYQKKNKKRKLIPTYQRIGNKKLRPKIILITAWRYPGKSPERNPIPQEIIEEVKEIIFNL